MQIDQVGHKSDDDEDADEKTEPYSSDDDERSGSDGDGGSGSEFAQKSPPLVPLQPPPVAAVKTITLVDPDAAKVEHGQVEEDMF